MSEWVCGTGMGNFPKPGDPDSNVILKATPAFGGIDVEWTYPGINPQAVAHTNLYRSTANNVNTAVRHAVVGGNFFYDKTTTATPIEYFYWIEIVSVNGTYSEKIGPASATARPTIQQMLELLTGEIDAGVLAQSLKESVEQIQLNKLGIDEEILERAKHDAALGAAYNEVEAHSAETRALLQQEVLARTTNDAAFVTSINTLYATLGKDLQKVTAAVQVETDARVSADAALAKQITTAQTQMGTNLASVQTALQTNITQVNGKVTEIGALYTAKVDVNGMIGGFGVYNDGTFVEAGFDVDRFWVGRTRNKVKPFIIENDEVFMDQAMVRSLTFTKLRADDGSVMVQNGKLKAQFLELDFAQVSGAIQSSNFKSGQTGWKLDRAGAFENNGMVSGEGRMTQTNQAIKVFDGSDRKRVQLGNLKV